MATISGERTINEEAHDLLRGIAANGLFFDVSNQQIVGFIERVARATKPSPVGVQVEPMGKTVWDWIQSKNIALMRAASHEGAANAILSLVRGMETWARDRNTTLDYVDVAQASWTPDGRLIIEFKRGE